MPAVLRQPEVGSRATQPHVTVDQRTTAPGNDQTREDVGVHDTSGSVADLPEPGRQESAFNAGDVRDEDAATQLLHQLARHRVRGPRRGGIDRSDAMDDDGPAVGDHERTHCAVVRPTQDDSATINRHDADGQDFVGAWVQARRLEIDDGE